ncbi:hypothetical protein JKP88DRAFT_337543 [Tribonema minus]|uniref:Uncharacterized protein n=1 Tax=Tribonema minus TaxID=303371 RepID=A0A835YJK9_9STRA|nr:hypothetical protein JKP88DRAFT_337543 [Tribonema minus]
MQGSPTSSRDVENVINESSPGAVVLELCESRFKALSRELAAEQSVKEETEVERIHAVLGGWVRGLKSTQQKKGLLQALTAGLVSSGYLWQKLNNFDPGCEFKTAMALSNARGIDIVLGDRDINETLGRLNGKNKQGKRAPKLQPNAPPPPPLLKAKKRWSVDRSLAYVRGLGRDARVLRLAVAGESGQQWPAALNVPRCIFWRGDVLKDLFGLLAPLTAGIYVMAGAFEMGVGGAIAAAHAISGDASEAAAAAAADAAAAAGGAGGVAPWLLEEAGNVTVVAVASLVMLRFFRLVIHERDVYLARAIQQWSVAGYKCALAIAVVVAVASLVMLCFFRLVIHKRDVYLARAVQVRVCDTCMVAGYKCALAFAVVVAVSLLVMLRSFCLVVHERDVYLARAIQEAARAHPGEPVVAVLGLLHCNGVAQLLRSGRDLTNM